MSTTKKQTAVEWLLEKISLSKLDNRTYLMPTISNEEIEQAKAMEREQIMDAWGVGFNDGQAYMDGEQKYESAEQYYNETYD